MENISRDEIHMKRLDLPRLNWGHFIIMVGFIFPNLIIASIMGGKIFALMSCIWLIYPCTDVQFGKGKKYYWIRQTILIIGIIATWFVA